MRRILLWFLTTVSTVVLLFGYKTSTSSALPTDDALGSGSTVTTGTTGSGSAATAPPALAPTANGTFTGTSADTRWGPVQVRVTVAAGHITAVDVVEYPTENRKDQEINADAVPELVSETLDAQGADIDMISGATVTSTGYVQSLQSALDQAGVA
jgi:uncharacterized protein with FMN-binding domain